MNIVELTVVFDVEEKKETLWTLVVIVGY